MKIPDFPEFARLECYFKDELSLAFKKYYPEISEFSTAFLFGYSDNFQLKITKIYENICVYGTIHTRPSFLPPIGNSKIIKTTDECLNFLQKIYGDGRINAVPKNTAEIFLNDNRLKVLEDRDDFDYVYSVEDLANLLGSKYQSKRNFVKQFEQRYKYEYRQITPDIISECRELQEKWCNIKNCMADESMSMENKFVYKLLDNFELCNLFGAALIIDGKVQAFTIAEGLNVDTAVIHVEKANTEYRGIYQAINNMFCKEGLGNFKYVNREQDVGDLGLRKAKLSYHPVKMIEKYNIELVDTVMSYE